MSSAPSKYKCHDPKVIEAAVDEVKAKRLSMRKAAIKFGLPLTTLSDKVAGRTPMVRVPPTLLTIEEETRLVDWLLAMSRCGFGQTTDDIRVKAKAIIELQTGATPDPKNIPSPTWVYRFFKRHPELSLRTPMSLGKERAIVTPAIISKWFREMNAHLDGQDPTLLRDPKRLYNSDETGFSFDAKGRKVVAFKGSKHVYAVSANTRTQVSK